MSHSDFNMVLLKGRLTADPSMVTLPSGDACVNFSVALNSSWKDNQGTDQEEVSFVDCKAYRGTAEMINKNFYKGRPIFIEGKLKQDRWKKPDGTNGDKIRVIIKHFEYLDSPKSNGDAETEETKQSDFSDTGLETSNIDTSGDKLDF
jgi:single-strand DNA-binding protein